MPAVSPDHAALLGFLGDELVGVASYELIPGLGAAEVALAVADGMHGRGIATLLLEHMVSLARACGVMALTAEALPDNSAVLRLLADSGLAVRRTSGNGVVELSMPVPQGAALGEASAYLDAVAGRENRLIRLAWDLCWRPGRSRWSARSAVPGRSAGGSCSTSATPGFGGALYAVGPQAGGIEGIPCAAPVAALPEAPDLAVVTMPAAASSTWPRSAESAGFGPWW